MVCRIVTGRCLILCMILYALIPLFVPNETATADPAACVCGVWGDVTGDDLVNPVDVVYMVQYVYKNEDGLCSPPFWTCPQPLGDANCDGAVNPVDVVIYAHFVYANLNGFCADPCGPSGDLLEMTGCLLQQPPETATISVPSDQDCIEYSYNGAGLLTLRHLNAGFNCCPEYETMVQIVEGVITIEEIEIAGMCDCLCLFDLDYRIINLPPGQYTIQVIEPYTTETDEKLEFTVDLQSTPNGMFCVSRDHYPWGY